MQRHNPIYDCLPGRLASGFAVVLLALALVFGISACGADSIAGGEGADCDAHTDCDFGLVCTGSGVCEEVDNCQFCEDDDELICYNGVCTGPECVADSDCDDAQCIDGVCGGQSSQNGDDGDCQDDSDCPDGSSCHPMSNSCVEDDNSTDVNDDECSNDGDCPGDETCDDGSCIDDSGGSGECELDASDCTGDTPHFDDQACECVECGGDTDCAAGEQCIGGSCQDEAIDGCLSGEECDPQQPGSCSSAGAPYCIDECCVECIGAGDCDGNEICSQNGFCEDSSGCTSDADCPSGHECDGGSCISPDSGADCTSDADCPDGQTCDPLEGECVDLGGSMGCGMCNDDCTCDHPDLTCDGFMCTGCVWLTGGECGDDEWCYPAEDFDMADENFCGPAF